MTGVPNLASPPNIAARSESGAGSKYAKSGRDVLAPPCVSHSLVVLYLARLGRESKQRGIGGGFEHQWSAV